MSLPVNKKNLSLSKIVSKTFTVLIDDFTFAVTFLFRIRERIKLTFVAKIQSKLNVALSLKRIRTTYQSKLVSSITQIISSRRIRLTASAKEIGKIVTTITLEIPIIFISKAIQKLIAVIKTGKLAVTISPILAQFFVLGDYDPDTLGDLDAQTLGDLDYVIT